jgi:hypothetical protein
MKSTPYKQKLPGEHSTVHIAEIDKKEDSLVGSA